MNIYNKFIIATYALLFSLIVSAHLGITGNVVSGDLTVSAVPLPAAVWLFGAGVLDFAGLNRKKAQPAVLAVRA